MESVGYFLKIAGIDVLDKMIQWKWENKAGIKT